MEMIDCELCEQMATIRSDFKDVDFEKQNLSARERETVESALRRICENIARAQTLLKVISCAPCKMSPFTDTVTTDIPNRAKRAEFRLSKGVPE